MDMMDERLADIADGRRMEALSGQKAGFYERYHRTWWFSALLNLALLAILLLLCRPKFETNDDMGIAFFINRARPIQDTYLLFENRILGIVMAFLYRITNMIPWYGVLQYAGLYCSFTGMTYVFLNHFEGWTGLFVSGGLMSLFGYEGYIVMQFTKTGGLITACGILLIFYAMTAEKLHRLSLASGLFLTFWGFLYREEEPLLITAFMCVFGLYLLLELPAFSDGGQRRKMLLRYFGCLAAVAAIGIGVWAFHDISFSRNEESTAYRRYNNAHSVLSDYGWPSFEAHRAEIEALGIDEATYNYYKSWNYYDPDLVTTELFEKLAEIKQEERGSFGMDTVRRFLEIYPSHFFDYRAFYVWMIALAFALVFSRGNWRVWLCALLQVILLTAFFLYLFYKGRYGYNRVECPVWLASSLVLLMMVKGKDVWFSARQAVFLLAACFLFQQNSWSLNWRSNVEEKEAKRQRTENQCIKLSQDQDHLYLLRMGCLEFSDAFGPLNLVPIGVYSNTAPLGGWGAGSPSYKKVLERYGVVNPFRDAINNQSVYLIDKDIESTMEYIHTHYDPHAMAIRAGKIGKYPYYELISEY